LIPQPYSLLGNAEIFFEEVKKGYFVTFMLLVGNLRLEEKAFFPRAVRKRVICSD
jgi:hypothetical protein